MKISYKKFKDFEDQWVAIDTDTEKILDSDKDIIKLQKRLEKSETNMRKTRTFFVPLFHSYIAP